jgi:DNA-binding CsgD family transcriptional regulator
MPVQTPAFDPEDAIRLAQLVETHADVLAEEAISSFRTNYGFSNSGGVDEQGAHRWTMGEISSIVRQLESGRVDPKEYESVGGDMVLQHEEQLYQIDAYMECCLFFARLIAQVVWRECVGDTRVLNRLLATLEAFTQARIIANIDTFAQAISQPRTLIRSWHLGAPKTGTGPARASSVTEETSEDSATQGAEGSLSILTPQERRMALLVANGKSNAEVASELGVRTSTVKNTLSRVYEKLHVASRVDLALMIARISSEPANATSRPEAPKKASEY